MDDLARAEYPAMLANLQPGQAVQTLNDRVKRINKVNTEVADWIAQRRQVEEQYVMGLRRLAQLRTPGPQSELGVFQSPWARIIEAIEGIALSHHEFAERLDRDVEQPLRSFQNRKDSGNMTTISTNLSNLAKDLEDATEKSDKLSKKGGKASTQKMDAATSRLESATQQWESQAPFVYESLQAYDESRCNQLRDLLTQYQTHESDQAQRTLDNAAVTLSLILEVSTEKEIQDFAQRVTKGRPRLAPRVSTRQSAAPEQTPPPTALSREPTRTSLAPPASQPSQPVAEDAASEHNSVPPEPKPESKLRRLGTMFGGRRRQSMHGGFSAMTTQKSGSSGFGRIGSSQGRPGISPRASASNLNESRLASLAEAPALPTQPEHPETNTGGDSRPQSKTNGVTLEDNGPVTAPPPASLGVNGTSEQPDIMDAQPPPGPPPGHPAQSPTKDSEGFTVPAPMNDPISEAQREAAGEEADQVFKLNIQNSPVAEEDPQAKEAAMSSVFNTLKMGPATRRSGTVRGRRDVRNTIYVPAPTGDGPRENVLAGFKPDGPAPVATGLARPSALSTLASESSLPTAGSDSQSVRSGTSLGSIAHAKHPEMTGPGLNASIIETVSVVFQDGVATTAWIAGEIAFAYNADDNSGKSHETIKINDFTNLERIGPNRIFVQNTSSDSPDQFTLDTSHLSKTAIAFSYRVFADEAEGSPAPRLARNAPILLKPAWKPQGDKLGLLLQYHLNPAAVFTGPVTLHNVVFVATYEGKASGAQTKPSGTHLKEKHLVYWRLGDVTLTSEIQKIVCRIVGADGVEPKPGHVEARWEYAVPEGVTGAGSGITFSRLVEDKGKGKAAAVAEEDEDDPFADESRAPAGAISGQTWRDVPLVRKLVSGKYEAQ